MNAEIDLSNTPNDHAELLKLFNGMESGVDPDIKQDEPKAEEKPAEPEKVITEDKEAAAKVDVDQSKQDEAEAEGIATKDGKHVIPFSVLKGERDRAAKAEQLATEAQQRIQELEEKLNAVTQGTKTGENVRANDLHEATNDLTEEELELLKEDFPTVYKATQLARAMAAEAKAKAQIAEDALLREQETKARTTAEEVQEAIDSIPKLAHLQANDKEMFSMAKSFDESLREQPFWQDKPMKERFERVVFLVENATGTQIELPASNKQNLMSNEDMAKAARAKAEALAKANKTNVPVSLSEFPAGRHVAADEKTALEEMSHFQLAEKMAGMSPEQMEAYFQSL